jgi:ubiquinone/menaquinone biosynthesis C-methylase UbiE
MVVSLKKHFATERYDLKLCLNELPKRRKHIKLITERIKGIVDLKKGAKVLEIGAAQGLSIIAFEELGYDCVGVEPWEDALDISKQLAKKLNIKIDIKKSVAEELPFADNSFDVVIADSVMEHVKDVECVMREVFRVLKKEGAFYFSSASAMCPYQGEIRFFPFFSWYPQRLKVRIMKWAVKKKPSLVGYTDAPAINWFTPWKADRLLKTAGFSQVYGTWDVLREEEVGRNLIILKIIRSNILTKLIADIFVPGCLYIALKK